MGLLPGMSEGVQIFYDGRALVCRSGGRLLDILDELGESSLPIECRAAHCGACLVKVAAGVDALLPPSPEEQRTLKALRASPDERLGCQIVVKSGTATPVVLRHVT